MSRGGTWGRSTEAGNLFRPASSVHGILQELSPVREGPCSGACGTREMMVSRRRRGGPHIRRLDDVKVCRSRSCSRRRYSRAPVTFNMVANHPLRKRRSICYSGLDPEPNTRNAEKNPTAIIASRIQLPVIQLRPIAAISSPLNPADRFRNRISFFGKK
jgi:hypothetical protein